MRLGSKGNGVSKNRIIMIILLRIKITAKIFVQRFDVAMTLSGDKAILRLPLNIPGGHFKVLIGFGQCMQ